MWKPCTCDVAGECTCGGVDCSDRWPPRSVYRPNCVPVPISYMEGARPPDPDDWEHWNHEQTRLASLERGSV